MVWYYFINFWDVECSGLLKIHQRLPNRRKLYVLPKDRQSSISLSIDMSHNILRKYVTLYPVDS